MNDARVVPGQDSQAVPAALVEYADRLLLSTGLSARDALRIASGRQAPPAELGALARALRAGWSLEPPDPPERA